MRASAAGLALGLLLLFAGGAAAFKHARSAHGARLFWPTREIGVRVGSLPPPLDDKEGRATVQRALQTWSDAGCGFRLSLSSAKDAPIEILVIAAEAWDKNPTFAAHTQVRSDDGSGRIEGATVRLNGTLSFSDRDPVAPDAIDLESLVLHEVGHALGLGHSYVRSSVMAAGTKAGERQRELTDDDKKGLCEIARTQPPRPRK